MNSSNLYLKRIEETTTTVGFSYSILTIPTATIATEIAAEKNHQ